MEDEHFIHHFDKDHLEGKALTKAEVQKDFGLEEKPQTPLVAMISRIADQKGFCELLEGNPCALERIVRDRNVQMVIIGTGDKLMETKLLEIGNRYPNLSVNILFSNRLAHRLEAGADYFLMPSRFEPCGLNQLYSLRYGTIPVARKTGGLADSIIDVDEHPDTGNGFLFTAESGEEIEKTVTRALSYFGQLDAIRKRAMGDLSFFHQVGEGFDAVGIENHRFFRNKKGFEQFFPTRTPTGTGENGIRAVKITAKRNFSDHHRRAFRHGDGIVCVINI